MKIFNNDKFQGPSMKKIYLYKRASAIFAAALAGCSSVSPDFSDMSQTYQTVLEKYQNNNLLLNIVRSSKNMPLSFLEIPSVVGTGNINETVGIGAFLYGATSGAAGGLISAAANNTSQNYNPYASLTLGRSFNFTQSSLENAQFQKGFISDITIETMTAFTKDHISKELLYTMVIDRFEVTNTNGEKIIAYNNPSSATYNDFQKQLRGLIDGGLTTEIVAVNMPVGPILTSKELANTTLVNFVANKDKGRVMLMEVKANKVKGYQFQEPTMIARFCFDTIQYKQEVIQKFGAHMLCGATSNQPPFNKGLNSDLSKPTVKIQLRSTRDIFDFLGQVASKQLQDKPEYIYVRGRKQLQNGEYESYGEYPLIVIEKDSKDKPIAIVAYGGNTYSIPDRADTFSAYTFNLLSQFFNLTKVPGSVPPSPSVLIK